MPLFSNRNILASTFALSFLVSAHNATAEECPPKPSRLQWAMGVMGGDLRPLGQGLANPQLNPASLKLVARIRLYTEASKLEIPPKAESLTGAAKDEFIAAYIAALGNLVTALNEVETALNGNKNDQAVVAYQKILQLRKDGHLEFQEPQH